MHYKRSASPSVSLSPNKSPIRSIPSTHIIQNRYKSYSKAEDYIKHINNIYISQINSSGNYDTAYLNANQFRLQVPHENSKFKVSQFPKAKVNFELLEQQELVNAFNNIGMENKPKTKTRPKSTLPNEFRIEKTQYHTFSYKKVKVGMLEKCEICGKNNCSCNINVKDTFLRAILNKNKKIIEKIKHQKSFDRYRKSENFSRRDESKDFYEGSLTYDDGFERKNKIRNQAIRIQILRNESPTRLTENSLKSAESPFKSTGSPELLTEKSLSISPINLSKRISAKKKKLIKFRVLK